MKKFKKIFWYLLGAFMAFAFNLIGASAQMQIEYGVEPLTMQPVYGNMQSPWQSGPLWSRILSIIFSPIFLVIVIVLAFVIGIIIFFKRKNKNVKKDS